MTAIEKLKALNQINIVFTEHEYKELKAINADVLLWHEQKTYDRNN